ncbi:MAG: hypothetical protein QME58_07225 [Bacteroidota bacterium]|nr:hypothetical protein [Bacteroidota bacterium]
MKKPLSVIIITKNQKSEKEIHNRYDSVTSFPRLEIIKILFKSLFTVGKKEK